VPTNSDVVSRNVQQWCVLLSDNVLLCVAGAPACAGIWLQAAAASGAVGCNEKNMLPLHRLTTFTLASVPGTAVFCVNRTLPRLSPAQATFGSAACTANDCIMIQFLSFVTPSIHPSGFKLHTEEWKPVSMSRIQV
jgi:hypothetical protein